MTRTKAFIELIKTIPNEEIVCIDETSFSNVANSFYGYFKKGHQPLHIEIKEREKISCVAAISSTSYVCYDLQRGSYNTNSFYDFIENMLIPFLPKDVKYILMDNISFHTSSKIKVLLLNHGLQTIFIPPFSPKYAPIEEFFSVVKNRFRTLFLETQDFESSIYDAFESVLQTNTLPFYLHMRSHASKEHTT
jgi:transposase